MRWCIPSLPIGTKVFCEKKGFCVIAPRTVPSRWPFVRVPGERGCCDTYWFSEDLFRGLLYLERQQAAAAFGLDSDRLHRWRRDIHWGRIGKSSLLVRIGAVHWPLATASGLTRCPNKFPEYRAALLDLGGRVALAGTHGELDGLEADAKRLLAARPDD